MARSRLRNTATELEERVNDAENWGWDSADTLADGVLDGLGDAAEDAGTKAGIGLAVGIVGAALLLAFFLRS